MTAILYTSHTSSSQRIIIIILITKRKERRERRRRRMDWLDRRNGYIICVFVCIISFSIVYSNASKWITKSNKLLLLYYYIIIHIIYIYIIFNYRLYIHMNMKIKDNNNDIKYSYYVAWERRRWSIGKHWKKKNIYIIILLLDS